MKCIHCDCEVEKDDNFCFNCGYWTTKGYSYLKDEKNINKILNGEVIKQQKRFSFFISLLGFFAILFTVMTLLRGNDLFKPFVYIKKQVSNYIYGYNSSVIKTDNKYNKENIDFYENAIDLIKKDFSNQAWLCEKNIEVSKIEYELQENYSIPSVVFCDISYDVALNLKNVIDEIYSLFPNIKGSLTNITITNTSSSSEYIAYFQPLYQFVNIDEDIKSFNKVNKTQILLNSYYYLNKDILEKNLSNLLLENYYVPDATIYSLIAHELGHYISFVLLLKENNLENITYQTINNQNKINNVINNFNNGIYSNKLINEALNNFNLKYNLNYDIENFVSTISKYASSKDENGNIIADEVIAESVHDYYLHKENMKDSSREIINLIKSKLS